MGSFGNLLGDILGGVSKPKVPKWTDISLIDQQTKAIAANQAALPGAESVVSASNQFSRDQIKKMLEESIPGYNQLVGSTTSNIEAMLKGEVPIDVSNAVQNSAAGRALGGGYGGSGMGRNLVARDLGLTSLDLNQKGLSSAESWLGTMAAINEPQMLNVASMFISPQQEFQATFQNQENQWNTQWLKNQVAAQGDPIMMDLGQGIGGELDAGMGVVHSFFGTSVNSLAKGGGTAFGGLNAGASAPASNASAAGGTTEGGGGGGM